MATSHALATDLGTEVPFEQGLHSTLVATRLAQRWASIRRRPRRRPGELHRLAMPTLLLWGKAGVGRPGALGSVAVARAATEMVPNARLEVLRVGHGPWFGQPAQTAAAILELVR